MSPIFRAGDKVWAFMDMGIDGVELRWVPAVITQRSTQMYHVEHGGLIQWVFAEYVMSEDAYAASILVL